MKRRGPRLDGEPSEGLTDLHMLALGWMRYHPAAYPEDVAIGLGLTAEVANRLLVDLEAAGMIGRMAEQ